MRVVWRRLLVFGLSIIPLIYLVAKALLNQLGADPAKALVLFLGHWTFYFLLLTLLVTPLRRLFHWRWLMPHRRMLGLFVLFYALLHLLAYLFFILALDFSRFGEELIKRPYILLTLPGVLMLILMGVTSTQLMMKKLGKQWVKLHASIYLVAILAWLHVLLQVRSSYSYAVWFGLAIMILLGLRVRWWLQKRRGKVNEF